ncbi:MAG: hypothetical protein Q7R31_01905 [Candidatus Levybacteria bacterium]|nr:hypothetical protein [Candidatus Levybacteria bacterium]
MPEQEEKKRGHTGFINGIFNTPGTVKTVSRLGKVIFSAGPEVWIVVGTIVGVALLTLLVLFTVTASVPIPQTPPTPTITLPTPTP